MIAGTEQVATEEPSLPRMSDGEDNDDLRTMKSMFSMYVAKNNDKNNEVNVLDVRRLQEQGLSVWRSCRRSPQELYCILESVDTPA